MSGMKLGDIPRPNLEIFAEIVENDSKWLEHIAKRLFRASWVCSECLREVGFLAVLSRALSALFFKNRTWKIEKSELRELKFRDFELSKNGPETSFLDSWAPELQNALIRSIFRRTDCNFPAVSGLKFGRKLPNENPAPNVNFSQFRSLVFPNVEV